MIYVAGYILQRMMCKRVERERGKEREREYSVTTNNYLNLMIIVAKQDGV